MKNSDTIPVFTGYPKQAIVFLKDLKMNNDREWFKARKQNYEEYVLAPTKEFVVDLGERLKTISPGIKFDTITNGSGSIMRIYRDVRFPPGL